MAKIKVFEAATEGFRLIRREPKAVLVWSAVLFLVIGIPGVLLMHSMAPMFVQMSQAAADGSTEGMLAVQAQMMGVMPLIWLLTMLAYVVVGGAALRAVLSPDDRRFFYMRVGKSELWLVLSALVGVVAFYIIAVVAVVILAIVIAIPLGLMTRANEDLSSFSVVHWAIVLAIIAGYGFGLYAMFRFSMAPIMSFDQKRFRLLEAWPFTRGEGWRLVGLAFVITVAILVVELIIMSVLFAGLGQAVWRMASDPTAVMEFERQIFAFYGSPMMWLAAIVGGLLGGAYMALMFAPWARAYVMLKPAAADPADIDPQAEASAAAI